MASLNIDISSFCDAMPTVAPHRRSSGPKFGPTNFQTLQIVWKSALSEAAPACLQGSELDEVVWVLEILGSRADFDTHRKLTLFRRSEEDYRNLKCVDRNIVVSLLDRAEGKEVLYEAAATPATCLERA